MQIAVNLLGKLSGSGVHDLRLQKAVNGQGLFDRGELNVDSLLLVDGNGDFAFHHVLHLGNGAVTNGKLRGPLGVDRGADLLEVVLELGRHQLGENDVVLQQFEEGVGIHLRGKQGVSHDKVPSKGGAASSDAAVGFSPRTASRTLRSRRCQGKPETVRLHRELSAWVRGRWWWSSAAR